MSRYQSIFTEEQTDAVRKNAVVRCVESGLRLEDDNLIYSAFGIAVAKYLGPDALGQPRFENLRLETDWDKAKILGREDYGKGS